MIKKIVLSLAGLFFTLALSAQSYKITLRLQDADSGEPVGFATVSVTPEKGQHRYTLSDSKGHATLEKVRPGKYVLKAELLGYQATQMNLEVTGDMNLGVVKMEVDQQTLEAASVTALGNPVVIKKDTVEYNASSFKISDDNMLVDLLKKLPGIEVGEDGSITSNGETITKITIEGKTFFLDDPQLASQNIPAKLVDKVKVVKKKSEQAEFTGIDDGEDETVIDLSVKPGMMNGAFGNAMAGGGHDVPSKASAVNDWRWQTAFMGGRFTKGSQISVILNANNTNNRGFNDLSGSMMNSMMGGGGGMGRGGRGGGGGGWGGNSNGITTSWMGGVNAIWDLLDNKMELGTNYLYNGSIVDVTEDTYKETYMKDGSTLVSNNNGLSHTFTDGHRFGVRLEHKFSENTSILFQPQFNFGRGSFVQQTEFDSYTFGPGVDFKNLDETTYNSNITNKGFTNNSGSNSNWQTRGFLLLRQRLGIPGRTISANVDWNLSNNTLTGYNQSLTTVYTGGAPTSSTPVNQRYDQSSQSRSVGGRLVYTEPLGGNFYLEGSYTIRYARSESEKLTYNSADAATADYTVTPWSDFALGGGLLPYTRAGEAKENAYSNNIINWSLNQNIGLAFMYQNEDLRAQLGAAAIPTRTYNETFNHSVGTAVIYDPKTVWNFSPRAMLFYDFNDNSNVRLFYFGRSSQPSTSQLNPVLDNSNPLSLSLGNPYLNPYFSHTLRSELELSNRQTFFTLRVNLQASMVQDPITNATWYDATGRVFTFPVNGHNSFSGNLRIMLNTPIGSSPFSISNMMRTSYSKSGSYIGGVLNVDDFVTKDATGTITEFKYKDFHDAYFVNGTRNWAADFSDNTTRSLTLIDRFRVTYRSENWEIISSIRTRVSKPWYTVQEAVAATFNNQATGSVKWTIGRSGVEISTDVNYNWFNGYTTPQESHLVWNASLSTPLFRRQATLSLKAYDILDQAKNLMVTTSDNYYQETRNNTLGRYIMLSLTWRFGNFGEAGKQMRSRMGGGPGGYRGGGRPF